MNFRIGALRVGDKLMSINGKSLRGQPVTYAIQLLQRCGDTVLLTVCRDKGMVLHFFCLCPEFCWGFLRLSLNL